MSDPGRTPKRYECADCHHQMVSDEYEGVCVSCGSRDVKEVVPNDADRQLAADEGDETG